MSLSPYCLHIFPNVALIKVAHPLNIYHCAAFEDFTKKRASRLDGDTL
jgi:hypothetical protein